MTDWSAYIGENGCLEPTRGRTSSSPCRRQNRDKSCRDSRGDGTDAIRVPSCGPSDNTASNSQSSRVFDNDTYMVNFTVRFLGSRGAIPTKPGATALLQICRPLPSTATHHPDSMTPHRDDIKVCSDDCATAWGLLPPPAASAPPRRPKMRTENEDTAEAKLAGVEPALEEDYSAEISAFVPSGRC